MRQRSRNSTKLLAALGLAFSVSAAGGDASRSFSLPDEYQRRLPEERYISEHELDLDDLRGNDEFYREIERLNEGSEFIDISLAGHSLEGMPLYRATVGRGPRTVMIVTQQHGDEPLATESALYLLDILGRDSDFSRAIRDKVTVVILPRVNPDGWYRWQRNFEGAEDRLDPRYNASDHDLNRQYDPAHLPDPALVPEVIAVLRTIEDAKPDLLLDYHNQNNYMSDNGELDSMSVLWPTHPDVPEEIQEVGKRAALVIANGMKEANFPRVTLFPEGEEASISRNGIALRGTPTLLVEQRGLQEFQYLLEGSLEDDYDPLVRNLVEDGLMSMLSIVQAMANGTFDELDPGEAERIPERGQAIEFNELKNRPDTDVLLP